MERQAAPVYLGALTRHVWQWVQSEIQAEVRAAGFDDLTAAHVAAFRNPGIDGVRPSRLAAELRITKQSVNDILGHLEGRGYIARVPDPRDSRSRIISLTDRGRELEGVIWRAAENAERTAAAVIGKRRMHDLRQALGEIAALGSEPSAELRRPRPR